MNEDKQSVDTEEEEQLSLGDMLEEKEEETAEPQEETENEEEGEEEEVEQEEKTLYDIENDPRYKEVANKAQQAELLQKVIFENEGLLNQVIEALNNPKNEKRVNQEESVNLQINLPEVPQYFNTEDLTDTNSDSYKWFIKYGETIAENARNATLKEVDRIFDKKWGEKERQRTEQENQKRLLEAVENTKQQLKVSDADWHGFMDWFNDPNKDVADMLPVAYQIYNGMHSNNPTLEQRKTINIFQKKQNNRSSLPSYSQIGGETDHAEKLTEDEFLAKQLFDSLSSKKR